MTLSKRQVVKNLISAALLAGHDPVVHPNGFIQLKLVDGRRMHFWNRLIPRQKTASPIHDHIFEMHSEIVAGELLHCEIEIHTEPDGFYQVYEAKAIRDTETKLVPVQIRVRADRKPWMLFRAGDEYDFPAFTFHETSDREGSAISIIKKGDEFPEFSPRVLVRYGEEPDNEFTRDAFDIGAVIGMIDHVVDSLLPA